MVCTICQEVIKNEFVSLNCDCKYVYHNKCISKWLKKNNSCPTCRKKWEKKYDTPKLTGTVETNRLDEINRRLFIESIGINSSRTNGSHGYQGWPEPMTTNGYHGFHDWLAALLED